ncbi:MAG: hypothetical protein FRX49_03589 [Trebouxia sp. A1-2]|nr:MAG: hypothetical protein FRX49_03589 [Trebouxia sp. A1-2]
MEDYRASKGTSANRAQTKGSDTFFNLQGMELATVVTSKLTSNFLECIARPMTSQDVDGLHSIQGLIIMHSLIKQAGQVQSEGSILRQISRAFKMGSKAKKLPLDCSMTGWNVHADIDEIPETDLRHSRFTGKCLLLMNPNSNLLDCLHPFCFFPPLFGRQLIFSVAAQPLHNLIEEGDDGLQHLHPGLRLPHTSILLLQKPPWLCARPQTEVV